MVDSNQLFSSQKYPKGVNLWKFQLTSNSASNYTLILVWVDVVSPPSLLWFLKMVGSKQPFLALDY